VFYARITGYSHHRFIFRINRVNHTAVTSADKVNQNFSAYTVGVGRYSYQGNSSRVKDRFKVMDVHDAEGRCKADEWTCAKIGNSLKAA
jgi:hypothetical protein